MIPVLLILIPLVGALAGFLIKNGATARSWSLFVSILTLIVSFVGLSLPANSSYLQFDASWVPALNSRFTVGLDGMGQILCLLTAISFPLIFVATWRDEYRNAKNFYALMLLSQAGLMGVFLAMDALLFYFFWELALIPVYFLCSHWGGEKRIQATFQILYLHVYRIAVDAGRHHLSVFSHEGSFVFHQVVLCPASEDSPQDQTWLFWLFFIAFAIKMPIFPFHTWQPDTYEQSPTAVTMVLSGIMVKMGLFGVITLAGAGIVDRNLGSGVIPYPLLCIIGMIYASLIAIRQDDLKRLVAYSSIAHIGSDVPGHFCHQHKVACRA